MTRPGRPKLSPTTDPGPYYLDATGWTDRIDFAEMFGNGAPVELEIGCGRGMFLANEAAARPQFNFVGLEVAKTIAQLAAFRCLKAGVTNARILAADARKFLQLTPSASISAVQIYFPDPWWKRRHRKRRMVAPDVLEQLQRVLTAGGSVLLATDVEEYHSSMQKTFASFPAFSRVDDSQAAEGGPRLEYLTHFERKFRTAGKWIGRLAYNLTGRTHVRGNNSAEEAQ
jgi:tRNA (guanine-N7-)-methyltransferase